MIINKQPDILELELVEEAVFENHIRAGDLDWLHRFFRKKSVLITLAAIVLAGVLYVLITHFVYKARPDLTSEEYLSAITEQLEHEGYQLTNVRVTAVSERTNFFYHEKTFLLEAYDKKGIIPIHMRVTVDSKSGTMYDYRPHEQ